MNEREIKVMRDFEHFVAEYEKDYAPSELPLLVVPTDVNKVLEIKKGKAKRKATYTPPRSLRTKRR